MSSLKTVVVGGGVAGLETALALRALAGDRTSVAIIAPETEFVYRPMTVREPFAFGHARRHSLQEMVEDMGAELVAGELAEVDVAGRVARTTAGAELPYDALVLAMGARRRERYPHATTIDDRLMDEQLHGLVQDVEAGYVHSIAFVIPKLAWPLPMYELALMTAQRASDLGATLTLTIVTPERAPLSVFGQGASTGIAELLADAGVAVECSADAEVPQPGHVVIAPGTRRLEAERVIALPALVGPSIPGLPAGPDGFIPVDAFCRVPGAEGVYAAGDAADRQIKHGGLAALQADTIAGMIAADAGAEVERVPYQPEIRGLLLTGGRPLFLTARIVGGRGFSSSITDTPTWSPPTKIAAVHLAPYLDGLDVNGHRVLSEQPGPA
ncbi:MAG: sulfide:quinone oxidoreductase [Solirubrobacteraceae bacterium]|nr:sulfide:quinone oxidoreductase [Solirubrobacteraceae bacterium]